MKAAVLYVLAGLMLALIVSVAWWTRLAEKPSEHTVRQGETIETLAADFGVEPELIARTNGTTVDEFNIRPGEPVLVPAVPATGSGVWLAHGAGIVAEIGGVLLSFWLALVAGIVVRGYRQQILGISVALGIASYAASHAGVDQAIAITPGFLFASMKDGFMWAAAFPLFAAAFGMKEREGTNLSATGRGRAAEQQPVEDRGAAAAGSSEEV